MSNYSKLPYLGYGIGLRPTHYQTILETKPTSIDWLEIMTEDYLAIGGRPLDYLYRIREHYPLVMHGVSLSIGSCDPLNKDYLKQVKTLADAIEPAWISDHLCWTGVNGINLHDLMPLPYTEEALQHVVARLQQVQDYLGRQILLENVSSYITYQDSQMTEWEFLGAVAEQANCLILLDINNIYVSSYNHKYNPTDYLNAIAKERVQQFHLAGHQNFTTHIIDTHDEPIPSPVWQLYSQAVERFGSVSTLIERDDNIPPVDVLLAEVQQARDIATKILEK